MIRWTFLIMVCSIWTCCKKSNKITQYVGGIQINEADQIEWARTIKAAGMNLVQVTAYAKQGNWNTDHLWWEWQDTSNVIREIRAVKSEDLHVIMVLRVALQHEGYDNKFLWHGMIFPEDRDQMTEWFRRYQYFVNMWVKICQREGVELLAIASEMNALTATEPLDSLPELLEYFANPIKQKQYMSRILKYEDVLKEENLWVRGFENYDDPIAYIDDKIDAQKAWADIICHSGKPDSLDLINQDRIYLDSMWRTIIQNARHHYSGTLTLAANFDNYHEIGFWNELDCIGINAYFSLRKIGEHPLSNIELRDTIQYAWDSILTDIDIFKTDQGIPDHPVFFTEIGYTPKMDCTVNPWQGDGFSLLSNEAIDTLIIWKNAVDRPDERVIALKSLHDVVENRQYPLLGLSYWKMTTHDYHQGYEPFMLLIGEEETDSLQGALSKFLRNENRMGLLEFFGN